MPRGGLAADGEDPKYTWRDVLEGVKFKELPYRVNEKYEVSKGKHFGQWVDGEGNGIRLDWAVRLWSMDKDIGYAKVSKSKEEYNKRVEAPPEEWGQYSCPSFGRYE